MTREKTRGALRLLQLTDEEAVTLRRIAFGESTLLSLRRADVERLLKLRLIAENRNTMVLTFSGKEQFASLPRALLAGSPRQRTGL